MNLKRKPSPPHPGEVLREYLGDTPVTDAAGALGVGRTTISRLLSEKSSISPDMAMRLGLALGTTPELWAYLQVTYDLHLAAKQKRPRIRQIATLKKDRSIVELKGMLSAPAGLRVSVEDMRVAMQKEMADWDAMPPVGREFGSPDYERLDAMDALAFEVFGSMTKARRWLEAPNADLRGKSPEDLSKTKAGYRAVMRRLQMLLKAKNKGRNIKQG
jgi:addiction module HigA family antidote